MICIKLLESNSGFIYIIFIIIVSKNGVLNLQGFKTFYK